ncbi:MAG: SLC13 family permease [Paracoccaceae bacterium]
MMSPLVMVLVLLGAAVVMFTLNRPRMDAVALMMMVALPLTGIITLPEALMGFSDPNVILIVAFFVIGEALVRTGVAHRLGDWLSARAGASEARLIALLMVIVAGLGSFMSSTGVVALFIPIVLRIARRAGIAASGLMMPLSVAALISGMMTLVATPPNLVVQGELVRRGYEGFSFFAFAPFGLPILGLAILYMLATRRFLRREATEPVAARPALAGWVEEYGLAPRAHRLRIAPGSPLAGRQLAVLDLRASAGVNIIAIERGHRFGRELIQPRATSRLEAGDILLLDIIAPEFDLAAFTTRHRLKPLPLTSPYFTDRAQELGMAELLIAPNSRLVGQTVAGAQFRSTYDLVVIGMKHGTQAVEDRAVISEPLRAGDTLLVAGPWRAIRKLVDARSDLVLLDLPAEYDDAVPAHGRAPLALMVLAGVVALMVGGIIPNVQAALIGCLALGLFGCIDMVGAYRAIHWQSLILIVGMLPFSLALQRTGGVDLAADALLGLVGAAGPRLVLAAIFAATAILGLFISNTATAVLMVPIALAVAEALGASPYPFAMTVALAASSAFMTPVSSPVNTLVVGPGKYRFTDFVRIGVPFALVCMGISVAMVPIILPF